jgi:iron complex outermembrane receptor protein
MQCRTTARLRACVFAALSACVPHAQGRGDAVTVTPLDADEASLAQPASVLRGDELRRRQASSLGDTLDREVGVQSGGMGPGASRPVIRGQDAPRVRVLDNGLGTMDVSTISPDHLSAVETLGATQVEVLRGPATLIHGGGAIGGLVNVVTKRIPRDRMEGLAAAAEVRLGGAAREHTGLVDLNGGSGGFAWHLDAYSRNAGDYRIKGAQNPGDPASPRGRVPNSFVESRGANLGASLIGERGHVGVGAQMLGSFYGVPAGEQARMDVDQRRYEFAGELRDPLPGFTRLRARLGRNDYRHDEIEQTGEIATRFRNIGTEGRLELKHRPLGPFTGVLGFSGHGRRFSAVGEESFLQPVRSRGEAIFLVEEAYAGNWRFDLGGRVESERHRPEAGTGLPDRRFSPTTWSGGITWTFLPGYSAGVTLARAQRAPAIEELYANGPHAATATFEVGERNLSKEVSRNVDFSLRKTAGTWRWKAGVYANRFRNYVFAEMQDVDGDGVFDRDLDRVDETGAADPAGEFLLLHYRQANARFRGFEAELAYRPQSGWGARLFADSVRGRLEGIGNAPRIAPSRLGLEGTYAAGPWNAFASLLRVMRQDRIAAGQESATPGYTRLDAGLQYRIRHAGQAATTLFVQANNLLDQDIRVHTSFIKDSAPLPGRSLLAGLRAAF